MTSDDVRFEGIEFELNIPYEPAPDVALYTMFRLTQGNRLSLNSCTLTIRNDFGIPASFFYIQGPPPGSSLREENDLTEVDNSGILAEPCLRRTLAIFGSDGPLTR